MKKSIKYIWMLVGLFFTGALILFIINRVNLYRSINREYIKLGNISISNIEFQYFYQQYADEFIQTDLNIIDYIGLQPEVPYDKQIHNEKTGETWHQFFESQTINKLKEICLMLSEAKEKGITLSKEEKNSYLAQAKEELRQNAKSASLTINQYISKKYLTGATFSDLEDALIDDAIYRKAKNSLYSDITADDATVTQYYNDHAEKYDLITFRVCLLSVTEYMNEIAESELKTEAETEEEYNSKIQSMAKEKVLEDAQKIMDETDSAEKFEELAHIYSPDYIIEEYTDKDISLSEKVKYDDVLDVYKDWLFNNSRKEGDMSIIYSKAGATAYVLYYIKREPNTSKNETYYHIYISYKAKDLISGPTEDEIQAETLEAEKIYNDILSTSGSLDTFKEFADKYNEDQSTIKEHGYKKEITDANIPQAVQDWLKDASRKQGDIGFVKEKTGCYILYFEEETAPLWYTRASYDYKTEQYQARLKEMQDKYNIRIEE